MYARKHKDLNNFSQDLVERATRLVAGEYAQRGGAVQAHQLVDLLTAEAHVVTYVLEKMRRDFFDANYDAIVKRCQLLRIEDAQNSMSMSTVLGPPLPGYAGLGGQGRKDV